MSYNDVWTGAVSTDWNTAANWTSAGVPATAPPTSADNVTINAGAGTDTVTGSGALDKCASTLSSTGPGSVNLTGSYYTGYNAGSLNLTGFLQLDGTITDYGTATFANGATLDGGTTSVQGAATFGSGFTLENAELDLTTMLDRDPLHINHHRRDGAERRPHHDCAGGFRRHVADARDRNF